MKLGPISWEVCYVEASKARWDQSHSDFGWLWLEVMVGYMLHNTQLPLGKSWRSKCRMHVVVCEAHNSTHKVMVGYMLHNTQMPLGKSWRCKCRMHVVVCEAHNSTHKVAIHLTLSRVGWPSRISAALLNASSIVGELYRSISVTKLACVNIKWIRKRAKCVGVTCVNTTTFRFVFEMSTNWLYSGEYSFTSWTVTCS